MVGVGVFKLHAMAKRAPGQRTATPRPLFVSIVALVQVLVVAHDRARATSLRPESATNPLATTEQQVRKVAEGICANNKPKIDSLAQMLQVISTIDREEGMCKERYMPAINELDPILKFRRDQLCSDEAFSLLKDYHFRFIQPLRQSNRQPTQFEPLPRDIVKEQLFAEPRKYTVDFDAHSQPLQAPIAVRHFFLKLALQISYTCKRNLLNNLRGDAGRIMTESDREIMQMFDKDTPIGRALAQGVEKMDFDSVLYMPDLDGRLTGEAGARLEERKQMRGHDATEPVAEDGQQLHHLKTTANENSSLFQMIYACRNRFKPLYDKLIIPIVRLSKMGYDYQGPKLSEFERQYLGGEEMKHWLSLVHVCEIFKNTHIIKLEGPAMRPREEESGEPVLGDEEKEGTLIEVSDKKEVEALARRVQRSRYDFMDAIHYEPTVTNEVGDELIVGDENELNLELSRKQGHQSPFGFRGFLRHTASVLKKSLAKLDAQRFAHYRRHSLWYSGFLNFISSCSNVASITVTVGSTAGFIGR